MSNQNEFQYIEAKEFLNLPVIEISDVKSFTRFAAVNNAAYIFKIIRNDKIEFFLPIGGIIYKIDGNGFLTLSDMQQAQSGNFPGAKEYYEAKQGGFVTFEEYKGISQTGSYTKDEYDAANKAGFVKGFDKFIADYERYKKGAHTSVIPADINSPVKLHQYASGKMIKSYDEFEKIYTAGFPDPLSYNDAKLKGFNDAVSYNDGTKRGFQEFKEYIDANKLEIENKKEYDEYKHLRDLSNEKGYAFDKLQLFHALTHCENGAHITIANAKEMLKNAQEKFRKPSASGPGDQKVLPLWYTQSIGQEDKLIEFLKSSEELKKFGFYNTQKKSFEIFKASAVKIVVDGSNVAHNGKQTPDLQNIRAMIKELKFRKFTNIIVLVDATLRHRLKFPLQLEELKNELKQKNELHEVPSKTAADEFLINTAKQEKCLIVSNDEFRDWKKTDKWVNDKIDSIRIPFRILKGDKVILSGMEERMERPLEA